jgi:nucleotide-binding universal stress UspA family protein/hemerythrin-like domain-containing protein
MYRHLLVPVDDSDPSIEVIGNAVGLARAVDARITFFHAVPAPLRSDGSPAVDPGDAVAGKARELLAKAEAAARAFGVPCDSLQRPGNEPATAIVEAARGSGCDLIFMAAHGGQSGTEGSATLRVLVDAGVPVLVSAGGPSKPAAHAIGIIRDEHRSLAAVMHAWMQELAAARQTGAGAEPARMRAIVRYLQRFSTAQHHPAEEQHLFRRLRERTDAFDAELDELQRQHVRDEQMLAELAAQVQALERCRDAAAAAAVTLELEAAVQGYARFLWEHLGREEGVILPAAQQYLSESDWAEIDRSFKADRDLQEPGNAGAARQMFAPSSISVQ